MKKKLITLLAGICTAAVFLGACGSGSSNDTTKTSDSGSTTAAAGDTSSSGDAVN